MPTCPAFTVARAATVGPKKKSPSATASEINHNPLLITSHHIGVLEFAIPADADFYTEAEVQAIDKQRV